MKPMLAATIPSVEVLSGYPYLASTKIDGIRAFVHPQYGPVTRRGRPIANEYIRAWMEQLPPGTDGELVVGSPNAVDTFKTTFKGVQSIKGEPDFTYYAFDSGEDAQTPFNIRHAKLYDLLSKVGEHLKVLRHERISDLQELRLYELLALDQGFEGVMLRDPFSPYKYGRSTFSEGYLLKLKTYMDIDAVVVGFEELKENTNEQERSPFDMAERSKAKAGLVPTGTLGALIVSSPAFPGAFKVGTGFDDTERDRIWAMRSYYLGRWAVIKYTPCGTDARPRHPVFKDWRS